MVDHCCFFHACVDCQGVLLHERCFFLGKRHSDLAGSKVICQEQDDHAHLATVANQADADVMREYIRHTVVMSQTDTIYVWISNVSSSFSF